MSSKVTVQVCFKCSPAESLASSISLLCVELEAERSLYCIFDRTQLLYHIHLNTQKYERIKESKECKQRLKIASTQLCNDLKVPQCIL